MKKIAIIISIMIVGHNLLLGQAVFDCNTISELEGIDLMDFDQKATSRRIMSVNLLEGGEVVFCPPGIWRSSQDDEKRRWTFDWPSKYNNIYFKTAGGMVVEGMNEYGFSASLMYLDQSSLHEKEKELIPIEASLAINFFIDHFKSIDTALLALYDTRIYDNMDEDCAWPFRIVLHDSSGATAYVDHIDGTMRVFTPEPPALICDGPAHERLLLISHVKDTLARSRAEMDYIQLHKALANNATEAGTLVEDYLEHKGNTFPSPLRLVRSHDEPRLVLSSGEQRYVYIFRKTNFDASGEQAEKIY